MLLWGSNTFWKADPKAHLEASRSVMDQLKRLGRLVEFPAQRVILCPDAGHPGGQPALLSRESSGDLVFEEPGGSQMK